MWSANGSKSVEHLVPGRPLSVWLNFVYPESRNCQMHSAFPMKRQRGKANLTKIKGLIHWMLMVPGHSRP